MPSWLRNGTRLESCKPCQGLCPRRARPGILMLPGGYSSVLNAKDRDELRDEIVRFAQQLGFATVAAITVVERGAAGTEFISVDNTPQAFTDIFSDSLLGRRDPVMQHCRKQSVPIIWDQQTYTGQGLGELWEQQAQFGYNTGICLALHLPEGRHFVLGVDRDQPLPRSRWRAAARRGRPAAVCGPCPGSSPSLAVAGTVAARKACADAA